MVKPVINWWFIAKSLVAITVRHKLLVCWTWWTVILLLCCSTFKESYFLKVLNLTCTKYGAQWRSASRPPLTDQQWTWVNYTRWMMRGLNHASSWNNCPISAELWRRSGYIYSGGRGSGIRKQQTEPGAPVSNTTMHSTMIFLGVLFGLLCQAYTLPVKVSTKRKYFTAVGPL